MGVVVLSLFISLLRLAPEPGRGGLFRSVFILPMTISLAATGVIWGFMYNPDSKVGVINAVLETLGIDFDVDWWILELHAGDWLSNLGDDRPWVRRDQADQRGAGHRRRVGVHWVRRDHHHRRADGRPDELIEAAKVDGATTWQTMRLVFIPQLASSDWGRRGDAASSSPCAHSTSCT